MKFKLFGTEIEVTFLFVAFLSFMLIVDKSGYLIPTMAAVVIHEAAHLFSMKLYGCQPKKIRLIPASVEITRGFCPNKRHEITVSLSGPIFNAIIFTIAYFLSNLLKSDILLNFAVINLVIGFFNLLPFKGLDGGEILFIIIGMKIGEERAEKLLNCVNFTAGLIGLAIGVFLLFIGKFNVSVIIMSIYLLLSVIIKF